MIFFDYFSPLIFTPLPITPLRHFMPPLIFFFRLRVSMLPLFRHAFRLPPLLALPGIIFRIMSAPYCRRAIDIFMSHVDADV